MSDQPADRAPLDEARVARRDDLDAFVTGFGPIAPTTEGQLSGLDVVVKDCFAVEGHTCSNGSRRWLETHGPASLNSALVEGILAAGGSIVGMGRMDQLAFSLIGNTPADGAPANPRHPELWCGGSSAGTAAAVAGGRATLGIGTDTAGSVRVPSALCGVHGLRPTWGSMDMTGCIPLAPSFDTAGIIAANPLVMRLAHRVLSSLPHPDALISRVVVDPSLSDDPHVLMERAAHVAAVAGATLEQVDLSPLVNRDVGALHNRLQGREVWASRGRWVEANMDSLDPEIGGRLRACAAFAAESVDDIEVDHEDRRMFTELLAGFVDEHTVLVKPVLGRPLPARDAPSEELAAFRRTTIPLMAPAGLTGWPELTWTDAAAREQPRQAVGLLARAGNDELLVDLLERLWSAEHAPIP